MLGDGLRDANDLWPAAAASCRRSCTLRDDLEAALGRPVLMTGSGLDPARPLSFAGSGR